MMRLKTLLTILALSVLVACSSVTTLDESFYLDSNTPWQSAVTAPGRLDLIIEPKQNSTVILYAGRGNRFDALEILISDRDCDTGFEISLREFPKQGAIQYQYFESPIVWGEPIHITLEIHADHTFTVHSAGQSLSGKTSVKPSRLALTAIRGNAHIQQLSYQSTHRE